MIGRCFRCRKLAEDLWEHRGEYVCEACFDDAMEYEEAGGFDADELGLDPEENYDA